VSEQNKRLVREITDVIWNRRGLDRSPEFYATDFVGDYRPYSLREGHEGIRAMVKGAWTAFPDYHEEIHDLIAEGDRIVLSQCRTSRTQRNQDRRSRCSPSRWPLGRCAEAACCSKSR
jgi:hypothetical protein